MKAINRSTRKDAYNNERGLVVIKLGHGAWRISCEYRGKVHKCITHNSVAIDEWYSDDDAERRVGYISLCNEIARNSK